MAAYLLIFIVLLFYSLFHSLKSSLSGGKKKFLEEEAKRERKHGPSRAHEIEKTKRQEAEKKQEDELKKNSFESSKVSGSPTVLRPDYLEAANKWKDDLINELDGLLSAKELLTIKPLNEICYVDLLKCFEWQVARINILLRDKYTCVDCKQKSLFNHVHHKFYIKDKLPWEIEDQGLVTLCNKCHKAVHATQEIPVVERSRNTATELYKEKPKCDRCGGIGYFEQFGHVYDGICFKCHGNTINPKAFFIPMRDIFNNITIYNTAQLRDNYKSLIRSIHPNFFVSFIPNASDYLQEVNPSQTYNKNSYQNTNSSGGDDLPF